ncbi:MAG: hypothetical protein AUI49_02890 [Candidatus Rokubacteria bacterium 13_1_40CM_2_68_13]|nr:MAG: hypothetical protein AUI49_02890 [Candidatus Rokubacteria bacterium 13_1_40CM_2_68_13]
MLSLVVVLGLLIAVPGAQAANVRYAVKYVCGSTTGDDVLGSLLAVRSTLVTGGLPPTFATVALDSGKSTVIDCSSIAIRLGLVPPNALGQVPATLFEGFVTINSPAPSRPSSSFRNERSASAV